MTAESIQFRQTKRKSKDISANKLPESSRHIPPEIAEEIVLNLPIKSLFRFSTVSKSWNSMIHSDRRFMRKYRSRGALPGRERVVIPQSTTASLNSVSTLPLSGLLSNEAAANITPLLIPFEFDEISEISLLASCSELWCVEYKSSLFLWNRKNPSMGTLKKLPNPSNLVPGMTLYRAFAFGIGYDSVEDDYKILKMRMKTYPELYSLRSDSWKTIQPFSTNLKHYQMRVVYASGALYWVDRAWRKDNIASFELSTEKYAEVAQPPYDPPVRYGENEVMVTVIKQKLCLHMDYSSLRRYVLWVMEDCEGGKSWIKMFDIDYSLILDKKWSLYYGNVVEILGLIALYFDHNGKILMHAIVSKPSIEIMCVDGKSEPQTVYSCNCDDDGLSDELYSYVESLVSPATYCSRPRTRRLLMLS